jgi:glycosyltransferase involved in cell wall biosynthesis
MIDRTLYNQPLVSICIPTYNSARFLRECLNSIVNQTYSNKEIIVSDNASTDETEKIVKEYVEKYKVKYYKNEKNIGAEANFTRCIELANGEYIAIFHADDLYMPDMVQKQVEAFKKNPKIGAVFTMATLINSKNEMIGKVKLPANLKNKYIYDFPEIFFSVLENLNFLVCPSAMVRSKIYKELVPFNEKRFKTSADLDMWFRILERYSIAIPNEKLMNLRISDIQGSFQSRYLRTEQADFFKVIDYYLSTKVNNINIPKSNLNKYEFLRSIDKIRCAVNYLIQGKEKNAKRLLKKTFSFYIFLGAISSFKKTKFLIYWISGLILLVLICLGLGKYIGKSLYYLLYRWKRNLYNW